MRYCCFRIQKQFQSQHMNILDAEEMAEVEKLLLLQQSHQPYTFVPLETSLMSTFQDFTSSCFLPPTQQIQQQTQRLVSNARNIKSLNREDPNSLIKIFNRSVFAIIFPTSNPIAKAEKEEVNDSLLETLKCSLYSKDLNFNHIVNKKKSVDNLQAKSMMSKFFHSLEVAKQLSNAQKIRFIEWSLEKNQLLQQLFILFYRVILGKVYVDGADDYESPLNFQEAITNLIEYFDINYRNFGELFLVPQLNYFLASVNTHFVLGEYVQSEAYKGKESLKSTDEKLLQQSLGRWQSYKKSAAIIENDLKLFNFIIESGRSSHNLNDKDLDEQTPHFKDSHQFAFGRKRKDEEQINRQQEIIKQFQKFFMSSQAGSMEEAEPNHIIENGNKPSFPHLAGLPLRLSQQFVNRSRNQTESDQNALPPQPSLLKRSTFQQFMIDELANQVKDRPKINPVNHRKNIVVVKHKHIATFSPQISNNMYRAGFSNFVNDTMFFEQEGNADLYSLSSPQNLQNFVQCACEYKWFQNRRKRNRITSKVVQFAYFQPKTQRAPKFVQNVKHCQNINLNNQKMKAFPKESSNLRHNPSSKQIRKPSFLNFLKKNRQAGQKSHFSHSRSKISVEKKSPSVKRQTTDHFQLDKSTVNQINDKRSAFSIIITKNPLDVRPIFITTKSATKRNENLSLTKITPVTQSMIKKFDSKYLSNGPAFGKNWKIIENTISPKVQQRQVPQSGMFQSGRNQNVRVYAPVNIIAPTVYFNGANERDNRAIFTVNNEGGPRERDMGLKMSDRHLRTETNNYYPPQRMVNPQLNRYI